VTRTLLIAGLITGSCAGQELKVVKNAPFTATSVTTTVQTLADGSKVTRTTTALLARDSEGRTRREQGNAVFLFDPVAGMGYVLDTGTHEVRTFAVKSVSPAQPEARQTTRLIEGIAVETTNLRRVIQPGEAGNDAALEILSEVSYSPELQEPIVTRTLDPRTGETTTQLKAIKRTEPDHALFEVPADYTLQTSRAR
jgi:hypothetical protein